MSKIPSAIHNAALADASLASIAGLGGMAVAGGALAIHRNRNSLTPAVKRSTAKVLHSPQAYHGTGLQHPRIQGYMVGGGIGIAAASIGLANNAVSKIPSYRTNAVGGSGPDPFVSIQREAKKRDQIKAASQPEENPMTYMNNLEWLQSSWLDKRAAEETKKAEEKKEKEERQERFEKGKEKKEDKKDDSKGKKDSESKESFFKKKEEEREEKKASILATAALAGLGGFGGFKTGKYLGAATVLPELVPLAKKMVESSNPLYKNKTIREAIVLRHMKKTQLMERAKERAVVGALLGTGIGAVGTGLLAHKHQNKKASVHSHILALHHPTTGGIPLAALAIAAPIGYAIGTGINLLGTRLAESAGHNMSPNSIPVQHPYLTSLAGQVGGAVTGLGPLVSAPTAYVSMAGSQPMADEAERGHLVDAPLANYSYDNPHAGPFLSMFVPGMHAPNSAIAAQAIANQAQRERNFTWRHPVASTFLHGLIPGSGTAYAQAAAKIQDMKEKSAAYIYSDAAHRQSERTARQARYESLRADLAESRASVARREAASARREANTAKTSEALSDLGHAIHQYRVHKAYQNALGNANKALHKSVLVGGAVGLGALGVGALGSHLYHTISGERKKHN